MSAFHPKLTLLPVHAFAGSSHNMKVDAEAFEREFRKGLRILFVLLALVGCALAW
jgi:hypothetical protein